MVLVWVWGLKDVGHRPKEALRRGFLTPRRSGSLLRDLS